MERRSPDAGQRADTWPRNSAAHPLTQSSAATRSPRHVFRPVLFSGHLLCSQHFLSMATLEAPRGACGNLSVNASG